MYENAREYVCLYVCVILQVPSSGKEVQIEGSRMWQGESHKKITDWHQNNA